MAVAFLVVAAILAIAACSPDVPVSPTPGASGPQSQNPAQTQSPGASALPSGSAGTPGPTRSPGVVASPTPFQSRLGPDPCRLLTTDEVNTALGGGYQAGGGEGLACVFTSDAQGADASLVSVSVVNGDVITPIRSRYPDLQDVTVATGKAEWSASVDTLWLVIDGPKTVMVSMPGNALPDDQLKSIGLQLAQLAAGRI
jgi:hypothetical protein